MSSKKINDSKGIPIETRYQVLTECGYRCAVPNCTNELTINVHHIVEVKNGGGNHTDNLLVLCPYCHDKYHRSIIDRRSIIEWKNRIKTIYHQKVESTTAPISNGTIEGFSVAFSSYTKRTFPIWYFYEYNGRLKFHPAGFATYISKSVLITSRSVLNKIEEIGKEIPSGSPKLVIGNSIMDFTTEEIHTWGDIVFLRDNYSSLKNLNPANNNIDYDENLDYTLSIAQTPFIGQDVGFIYASDNYDNPYPFWHFALGRSIVSHFLSSRPPTLDRYVLASVQEKVLLFGGPVFLQNGTLVGILTEARPGDRIPPSSVNCIVFGGFHGVRKLWETNK